MKKVFVLLIGLLAMMSASLSAKAQEVTINLQPGWTWISYPKSVTMGINQALGGVYPLEGDMVKSQFGYSEFHDGVWMGNLELFEPGVGYMYYSNREEPYSFIFGATPIPPTVNTTTPTNITSNSAIGGGEVILSDGNYIIKKGICWATHQNPVADMDFHTENGNTAGSFSATMSDLTSNTLYYVRAYVVTAIGITYGNQKSFTTLQGSGNDHGYVDLGLPSGLLWATCNVGANSPEGYGYYFAWGETQPKYYYDWNTYQFCNGTNNTLTKYCNNSSYGYHGFTDNLTTLLPEDDAATVNWGGNWRMPTSQEWLELYAHTNCIWKTQNGVKGRQFTASNGNSIFIPASGYRIGDNLNRVGSYGYCWSSSLNIEDPQSGWYFFLTSDRYGMGNSTRNYGRPIRAVRSAK